MTVQPSPEYVSVPVECQCDTPHGAEVFLLPRLSFEGGEAAQRVLNRFVRELNGTLDEDQSAELGVRLGKVYLLHQAVGWTCETPFSRDALLSDWTIARPVAEKADDLYSDAVLAPLVKAVAQSSQIGRTARSTSRTRSTSKSRKPSAPSTTPSTRHLRPVGSSTSGDSSTSPKSESAAA